MAVKNYKFHAKLLSCHWTHEMEAMDQQIMQNLLNIKSNI